VLALELFHEEKVSLARAAELSGTPLAAFMDFAAAHHVSPIRYGEDESLTAYKDLIDEKIERAFTQFEKGEFLTADESRADIEKRKAEWLAARQP
jgi:hypothetical protein